jgi:hypothetical protein
VSKLIIALVAGTAALFATGAGAAPFSQTIPLHDGGLEKVRTVCDQSGRCWRERGARRMHVQRESYGYDRRRHRHHHNHGGPGIGIQVPGVSIGVGGGRW